MPNTTSAKMRMHQNERLRLYNRAAKSRLKTQIKKVREALATDPAKAAVELSAFASKVDKAAAHGVIHHNMAARLKSRLSAAVKAAKQKAKA
jgi:small subunit ribosomal protein S20